MMFFSVFTQVAVLFILILTGLFLTKRGILTEGGVKSCTELVLMVVTPCVIIKSFIREFDMQKLKALLMSFLLAFLVHAGCIVVGRLIFHSKNLARERVLRFGVVFANSGFMSLPLQEAIIGEEGLFYGASFIAMFNLFVWSYGIITMSGDRKYLTPKKLIFNPGIVSVFIGLIIFIFSVPVPEIISSPISFLAALNTPLPMLIIGYHLANTHITKAFGDLQCLASVAVRLALLPGLALAGLYLCGIRGNLLVSTIISCSAPTAAMTTMFAAKFSSDTALSVNMVSLSTVFSIISMPVLISLAQYLA